MEKITTKRALAQLESNDQANTREDAEQRDQIWLLSDFELGFVGGGDDVPGWKP